MSKDKNPVNQHKAMAMGEAVNDGLKLDTARGVHFEGTVQGSTQKMSPPKAPAKRPKK